MRVFISYSTPDLAIVNQLASQIRPHAEVYYWAEKNMPGQEVWPSIFGWIDGADLFIVVITGNTVRRAFAVGHEVGRAIAQGKTIIPIVSGEISASELGCLGGIIHQPISSILP